MRCRWIVVSCLGVSMFPSSVHPTTIVLAARDKTVFIGIDSKRSAYDVSAGRVDANSTICKVEQYGTIVVAHYGTDVLRVKNEFAKWVTVFNSEPIVQRALRPPGTLTERANRLDTAFWPAYQAIIRDVPKLNPKLRGGVQRMVKEIDFVLAGKGRSGLPEAIVLEFTTEFDGFLPFPQKRRWSVPYNKSQAAIGLTVKQPLDLESNGVDSGILSYLDAAATAHSDAVGKPFTIVRISPDGHIHYEQAGKCH